MKTFGGPVQFLDRSDINTDEIIPAKYLTEVSKEALMPHCLEDLKLDGFDPRSEAFKATRVIVSRANFGCGSSREHAPWAFEVNGITVVIAESFARIFRQNMFNCGMLAIELDPTIVANLFGMTACQPVTCDVDVQNHMLVFKGTGNSMQTVRFTLNRFDVALVKSGGWVAFADARY